MPVGSHNSLVTDVSFHHSTASSGFTPERSIVGFQVVHSTIVRNVPWPKHEGHPFKLMLQSLGKLLIE